mmetsp:Transcript_5959/g.13233  ORF Transcript_5959/g.13233 Transcript_5959/m.13233 type:complete len:146 (-) Transcript_5959:236-673(-)
MCNIQGSVICSCQELERTTRSNSSKTLDNHSGCKMGDPPTRQKRRFHVTLELHFHSPRNFSSSSDKNGFLLLVAAYLVAAVDKVVSPDFGFPKASISKHGAENKKPFSILIPLLLEESHVLFVLGTRRRNSGSRQGAEKRNPRST